jgi:hypothetical protein
MDRAVSDDKAPGTEERRLHYHYKNKIESGGIDRSRGQVEAYERPARRTRRTTAVSRLTAASYHPALSMKREMRAMHMTKMMSGTMKTR